MPFLRGALGFEIVFSFRETGFCARLRRAQKSHRKTQKTEKHENQVLLRQGSLPVFEKVIHCFIQRLFHTLFHNLKNHCFKLAFALLLVFLLFIAVCVIYLHFFTFTSLVIMTV